MTDVRWEGLTHAEIYRRVQAGPGRGASLSVESAWSDTEALILGIEERLTSAVARSGGGWEGAAGDSARAGLSPLGNWAADAVGDARLTASGVLAQGEQAAWLRAAMPSPTAPLWDESPGRPGADPLYLMQDVQALEQRSADDTAQAVHLMNTYTGNSYENKRFLDYWTFPPSVTVETPAAPPPGPVPGDAVHHGVGGWSGPGGSGTGGGGTGGAGPGTGIGSPGPGTGPAAPLGVPAPAGGAGSSTLPAAPSLPGPTVDGDRAGSAGGAVPGGAVPGGGGPSPNRTGPGTGRSGAGGGAAGGYPPGGTGPAAPGGTRAPTGSAGGGARSATPDPRSIPAPWPGARPTGPAAWPAGPGSSGPSRSTPTWRDLLPPPTGPRSAPVLVDGAAGARSGPAAGEPPARSVGAGVAADAAARSGGGARAAPPMHPGLYPPMTGVGAGRPGGEHRRPDYLLDDTDAFADDRWFTPGVISADDPTPPRRR